jgi:hypothetical protein
MGAEIAAEPLIPRLQALKEKENNWHLLVRDRFNNAHKNRSTRRNTVRVANDVQRIKPTSYQLFKSYLRYIKTAQDHLERFLTFLHFEHMLVPDPLDVQFAMVFRYPPKQVKPRAYSHSGY